MKMIKEEIESQITRSRLAALRQLDQVAHHILLAATTSIINSIRLAVKRELREQILRSINEGVV